MGVLLVQAGATTGWQIQLLVTHSLSFLFPLSIPLALCPVTPRGASQGLTRPGTGDVNVVCWRPFDSHPGRRGEGVGGIPGAPWNRGAVDCEPWAPSDIQTPSREGGMDRWH